MKWPGIQIQIYKPGISPAEQKAQTSPFFFLQNSSKCIASVVWHPTMIFGFNNVFHVSLLR